MSAEISFINNEVDESVATVDQLQSTFPELVADVEDAFTTRPEPTEPERPKLHPNYPKNAVGMRHTAQWWENRRKHERRII